ncbi:hypothetical protein WOLCODRAFT_27030 [Wolfiporia cocos MD-104 SS10]|uniref:Uncharacterized protein n=1 Tax=Wolfiporia cocos (strain MD-104) TaxID=742152 RepID=A0A2H3JS48_WOLCO|nr:hypothetical protein WOLCODRAFT_27030 [Wolfiporia cocos MD-104 SS10]
MAVALASSSSSSLPMSEPEPSKAQFAFAQIQGGVYLVQVPPTPPSALLPSSVHVFRHEFITQFRFSHAACVHPAELHILEPIDERHTLYEADKGTVFLARELLARLQTLSRGAMGTAIGDRHARIARAAGKEQWRRPRVAGQVSRAH